jgi:hypothetical protein
MVKHSSKQQATGAILMFALELAQGELPFKHRMVIFQRVGFLHSPRLPDLPPAC